MGYQTRQSRRILDMLQMHKTKCLTAEEIYLLLKDSGEGVGQTTVYRHLERLCADGTVRKYLGGEGGGASYQFVGRETPCAAHFHLKCTACGELFHADCSFLNELSAHILKEHGFAVDGGKTVFYGLCAACAEKERFVK